jgi:lipopolysaccharide transport system ATP-binding protein
MENEVVIDVKNISKKYNITVGYEPDNLREKIVDILKLPINALKGTHKTKKKEFWALRDVSFQVKRGEVLGIIGRNGAGKSTMLKILSRITDPTTGIIKIKGRVASLLEVGTGFNPELTGRENIYLNGAIIGMPKAEIDHKLNDIIEFSGVKDFIDTPVKRYSSGMYVRLAFSVAAHLDSEILLLDEVLSVGDADFQKKSGDKMKQIVSSGRTILFVSHSLQSVASICSRCIYLESGKVVMTGNPATVITNYYAATTTQKIRGKIKVKQYNKKAYILNMTADKQKKDINVNCRIQANTSIKQVSLGISMHDEIGRTIGIIYSGPDRTYDLKKGENIINAVFKDLQITPGKYIFRARLESPDEELDWPREDLAILEIPKKSDLDLYRGETYANGQIMIRALWE